MIGLALLALLGVEGALALVLLTYLIWRKTR